MTKRKKLATTRTLGQIIDGYLLAAQARRLSEHTIADYINTLNKFRQFIGEDTPFVDISRAQIERFLAGFEGKISKKTLLNYHIGLSALWTWAYNNSYALVHLLHAIERPKPEQRAIQPYSQADLKAMMAALASAPAKTRSGMPGSRLLPNYCRNRAIILLLVDTGLRADELCQLQVRHVDTRNQRIKVYGKGSKERMIPISAKTGDAIWKYWSERSPSPLDSDERAFVTTDGKPLDRGRLLHQIQAIGKRAGVTDPDCHRFRHTFAINYLRNGGDVYTLQQILGHSTLEMCRHYLRLAASDAATAHRKASPVANWNL